jgi:hypothetical protein
VNIRDIAGIFSRRFIVGYFTPALIAWTTVILLTRGAHPARFEDLSFQSQLVLVVIMSGVVAALLSALRYEIRSALIQGSFIPPPVRDYLRARQLRRFELLDPTDPIQLNERDALFPDTVEFIKPTRFGNVVGAYESYPATRFKLDYAVAWKRIDLLLSAREVELQAFARADVEAFLNIAVLAVPAGAAVLVERLVHPSPVAASVGGFLVVSLLCYRLAVRAERRFGNEQRACFDLHRLELHQRFGLRPPASPGEEKEAAQWLSTIMLWPTFELPRELWKGEYPEQRESSG